MELEDINAKLFLPRRDWKNEHRITPRRDPTSNFECKKEETEELIKIFVTIIKTAEKKEIVIQGLTSYF